MVETEILQRSVFSTWPAVKNVKVLTLRICIGVTIGTREPRTKYPGGPLSFPSLILPPISLKGLAPEIFMLEYGAFCISALKIWNSLPLHILQSQTLDSFRRHLKTYHFQSTYPAP